jgi:hypothetical protein
MGILLTQKIATCEQSRRPVPIREGANMPSYKEVRLHLVKGSQTAVAVIWFYNDSAVIGAIERGSFSPLRSDRTFASVGQAFEAARALWLASLETQTTYGKVPRRFSKG